MVVVEELDLSADGRLRGRRPAHRSRATGTSATCSRSTWVSGATPRPRQLTRGAVRDTWPRLSPDGQTLAFVRTDPADDDAPAAIALLDLATARSGVRLARTGEHGAVGEIAWSPDGRRLAFTAEVDPPGSSSGRSRRSRRAAARRRRPRRRDARAARPPDHPDRLALGRRGPPRPVVAPVRHRPARREPRQVTSGDWGVVGHRVAPGRPDVAFTADRGPEPDLHPRTTIWAVDVDGRQRQARRAARGPRRRRLGEPPGVVAGWPLAGGDRRPRAGAARRRQPRHPRRSRRRLAAAPRARPGARPRRSATGPTPTSTAGWSSGRHGPAWVDDRRHRGDGLGPRPVAPARLHDRPEDRPHASTGPWPRPATLTTHTIAVAATPAGEPPRIAFLAHERRPGDGRLHDRRTRPRPPAPPDVVRLGAGRTATRCPTMRRVDVPGAGGPIETLDRLPARRRRQGTPHRRRRPRRPARGMGAGPAHRGHPPRRAPATGSILPNIRGSATYGRDWITPQLGDWGGVDAADVHAAVDHVVELGLADPERLGVMGLSYGGFMVNWLVGTTDRFKAAVSENGVTNQIAELGQLGQRPRVRPRVAPRRPVRPRRASTSSGASRRCATWRPSGRRS